MKPIYFESPAAFNDWLAAHHAGETELWVGYFKKSTGKPSMTWPQSVDEALCWGWIDGIRRSVDAERYMIRFTPRKPTSIWSAVNLRKVAALRRAGRMQPPGLKAYAARRAHKTAVYSFEQQAPAFEPADERKFRANRRAWAYWQARPAGYRRTATWWVISAKRPETRQKRLATLIEDSAAGRTIALLTRTVRK